MCFHISRDKTPLVFSCSTETLGCCLGTPCHLIKGDIVVPCLLPMMSQHSFTSWTWRIIKQNIDNVCYCRKLSHLSSWTPSWWILPVFLLSFYWPASKPFSTFFYTLPPTWIILLHPTLCSATEMVWGFWYCYPLTRVLCWLPIINTKGSLWLGQATALLDRSGQEWTSLPDLL